MVDTTGYRKLTSFFDFIDVKLHTHPDKYVVKQRDYYIWSETKQEMQRYEVTEGLQWKNLEEYVKRGLVYEKRES